MKATPPPSGRKRPRVPRRVEIGLKPRLFDSRGERIRSKILAAFSEDIPITSIKYLDVYNVESDDVDDPTLVEAFCDPVTQDIAIDRELTEDFDWYVEIGYKPGVTDNVGKTASYALELISGKSARVASAKAYLVKGNIDKKDVLRVAEGLLANTLIESVRVFHASEIPGRIEPRIPRVENLKPPVVEEISLEIPDEELAELSRKRVLALNLDEMKTIRAYLRDPKVIEQRKNFGLGKDITDVELEAIAQTWSEHCKHKIFNAHITYIEDDERQEIHSLFKTYIQGATTRIREIKGKDDICVSVFRDNAGVIRFNPSNNLVFKVETHNSPSALDPYGGALTGIVGVNRDPFGTGLGSRLIFNTDVFCFADPFYEKPLPPRILHPRRIFEGVREGVEHGGNKSGIPTVNGCIVFDNRYLGKPLVFCGTAGIMPREIGGRPSHVKEIRPGDLAVMCGGRIGKDGIHGATFSSEELHEESPTSAVQIGDPITQKKMTDFLLIARDKGLYRAITDNGAGGLSSSVGEMALLSGGCRIELDKPPLKYQGLSPWEILLSEAQERMTLAVPRENLAEFLELSQQMGVESTVVGEFTSSGYFHCTYEGKTVALLDLDFFHNGLPEMHLVARWEHNTGERVETPDPEDHGEKLCHMLSRLNICSKEYVVRQYDHEVQGGSVVKPLTGLKCDGPSDAAIIRPILDSMEGVVVSNGIVPRYSDIDTYNMAASALDEALRNYICVGGDPSHWACLDNFCWCDPVESEKNPDGAFKLAQLVRANKALYDYTVAFECPCISGKDSMKNDYISDHTKISIPPTLLFSVIGKINDVRKAVTMDLKQEGDIVYILGTTMNEMGCSEYMASFGLLGSSVPSVDATAALRRYKNLHRAMESGIIRAAHDISDGGLAVAAAEMAFSGGLGMDIDLSMVPAQCDMKDTEILYSETQSRILLAVDENDAEKVEEILGDDASRIGIVTAEPRLVVRGLDGTVIINEHIDRLERAWKATLDF